MKKAFAIRELDCAHCAQEIEEAASKVPGVNKVRVNFLSERMTLDDVGEATNYIRENTHPDVNIILGTVIDSSMGQTIRATIIATDFVDGVVMKAQRMEAPESKLKTESIASLEPPSFMKQPTEKVPAFASRSDFTLPKFDPFHPKK